MRGILAAVGRAVAALLVMVVVWCERTAKFVIRCVRPPADPVKVVEAYDTLADAKNVSPDFDTKVAGIQSAAELMLRDQPVPAEFVKGLKPKTVQWLALLDRDMLTTVACAHPSELADHLSLKKSLRGVVRFEQDAIDEYRRAVEADFEVPKRPSPRRTFEPISRPAFG